MEKSIADALVLKLIQAANKNRLGHSLILSYDASGDEIQSQINQLITGLLCAEMGPSGASCGSCDSCRLDRGVSGHPDFLNVRPSSIQGYSVEDIQELLRFASRTRALSPHRVAWIEEADLLSSVSQGGLSAANALLKLVEEPRPNTILIFSTTRPGTILATLRSRSQQFRLRGARAAREAADGLGDFEGLILAVLGGQWARLPSSPLDDEAWWKDRERAINTTEQVSEALWMRMREQVILGKQVLTKEHLAFVEEFSKIPRSLRGYVNGPLKWLNIRSRARVSPAWRP